MATRSGSIGKSNRQVKAKLGEPAELAQALMRCAGTGIYIVQDRKFQYVNSLFQELTGYTEQELLGMHSLDLVHPEDRGEVREKAIECLKGYSSPPYEYRFIKKNGEVMWILEKVTSTEYKGKRAAVGSFMDITERKRIACALEESAERFRSVVQTATDAVVSIDAHGSIVFWNQAAEIMFGYSADEVMSKPLTFVMPERFREAHIKGLNRTVAGGESKIIGRTVEIAAIRRDQSEFPVELSLAKWQTSEGLYFTAIIRDITERKRLEESLRQSEEKYRTILENMEDAYFEIDLAGNLTFFNDSMCRALGYSREELMGMDSRACTAQEDVERVYETLVEMYRTGEPSRITSFKFIRKDGGTRFSDTRISLLLNEKGEIVGFRGIGRDDTERRRLVQKLDEMATHDPLTGLPNRLLLNDRLAVGLTQAQRNDTRLAVMMLDLDRFKDVNDVLGHGVGDELLKAVGERLTGLVRKSDTVARMGGDEFVLLLAQIAKIEDATKVAQKILEAFRKPFVLGGHQIHTTTSIGIAIYPEDGEDGEALFKNADTAMYWVKEQGRDNYELYWDDGTKTL